MTRNRLEAFTDAVIAIAITIMVLELTVPHEPTLDALRPLFPVIGAYVLSFVNLGIYWNNHHHMMSVVENVNGKILWANLYLLFWLSLFPFVTGWMGENDFDPVPTAAYGLVSLLAAIAYYLLQTAIVASQGPGSKLAAAVGRDLKGKASPALYLAGIGFSFVNRWIALGLYVFVALMWLVPDRRIESSLKADAQEPVEVE
ncbi:MAG: TMEM175 family protein [Actinomycetota bacterium]